MIEIVSGFVSGIISGMGIGGGMILIPTLVFFVGLAQHEAQGVNLWYFVPTAIASLVVHIKNKNVEFRKTLWIVFSGVPFSLLGAYWALKTDNKLLGRLFGVFLIIFGLKEAYCGFTNKE